MDATHTTSLPDDEIRGLSDKLRDFERGLSPLQRGLLRQIMTRSESQDVQGYVQNFASQGIIIVGGTPEFDYYTFLASYNPFEIVPNAEDALRPQY